MLTGKVDPEAGFAELVSRSESSPAGADDQHFSSRALSARCGSCHARDRMLLMAPSAKVKPVLVRKCLRLIERRLMSIPWEKQRL